MVNHSSAFGDGLDMLQQTSPKHRVARTRPLGFSCMPLASASGIFPGLSPHWPARPQLWTVRRSHHPTRLQCRASLPRRSQVSCPARALRRFATMSRLVPDRSVHPELVSVTQCSHEASEVPAPSSLHEHSDSCETCDGSALITARVTSRVQPISDDHPALRHEKRNKGD